MSNLENLFVIELIFVKESGNSIKYGFTTAEQAIGFLQGEIAAQRGERTDDYRICPECLEKLMSDDNCAYCD